MKKRKDELKLTYREAPINIRSDGSPATLDEATRSVEIIGATEEPAEVMDYDRYEIVSEVLLMAGAEIPIEALVVGLADSFDAMTSSRTYRSAMPLEAVLAEIRRCSGTQFDSRLVEQFLTIDLEQFLKELRAADRPDETPVRGVA